MSIIIGYRHGVVVLTFLRRSTIIMDEHINMNLYPIFDLSCPDECCRAKPNPLAYPWLGPGSLSLLVDSSLRMLALEQRQEVRNRSPKVFPVVKVSTTRTEESSVDGGGQ